MSAYIARPGLGAVVTTHMQYMVLKQRAAAATPGSPNIYAPAKFRHAPNTAVAIFGAIRLRGLVESMCFKLATWPKANNPAANAIIGSRGAADP